MRFTDSIFAGLLKPIDRRAFRAIVARHDGDAYDKSFGSWEHLVALIYAQLSGAGSLRGLVAGWNAQTHHHYHLGSKDLARSTLADANARRPVAIFDDLFTALSAELDRHTRHDGAAMLRLLDATPIPLGALCAGGAWNGRIRGLKMHTLYDPAGNRPCRFEITPATVNDIEIGRAMPIEPGATPDQVRGRLYVFDKGYCHYGWWTRIAQAGALFVTRPKTRARWRIIETRPLPETEGDGFSVLLDQEVALASKGDSKLPLRLRHLAVERQDGSVITLLTNDMQRSAVEVAALYKARWQIELFFRWIKQHLKIRSFLGRSDNAIRLQIVAAMIAFVLLRLAERLHRAPVSPIRFAELVGACLFERKPLALIHRPPKQPTAKAKPCAHQPEFAYA